MQRATNRVIVARFDDRDEVCDALGTRATEAAQLCNIQHVKRQLDTFSAGPGLEMVNACTALTSS